MTTGRINQITIFKHPSAQRPKTREQRAQGSEVCQNGTFSQPKTP